MRARRALSAGHVAKFNPQSVFKRIPALRRSLAAWFAKSARALPWRRTRDPYAILVSEFMLQQTQVKTVIPYFERWLARFPDFATLAAANEHDVLSLWQGLGYYSRARNLHHAAQHVCQHHDGALPADADAIRALPGVGRYTAGAIASFAFDLPEPLVDANVARVLARMLDLHTPVDSPAGAVALWDAASALVPQKDARTFNAALMELGAIVCTPRNPQCLICPARPHCRAFAAGTVALVPKKKPRTKLVELSEHCAWTITKGRILLEHQTGPRWRGLWKLPQVSEPAEHTPLLTLEYPFTNHRITLRIFTRAAPRKLAVNLAWHRLDTLVALPLTAPHRRAIEKLLG